MVGGGRRRPRHVVRRHKMGIHLVAERPPRVTGGRRGRCRRRRHEGSLGRPAMVKAARVFVGRGLCRRRFTRQSDQVARRGCHSVSRPVMYHARSGACRNRSGGQGIQGRRRLRIVIVRSSRRPYLGRVDGRGGGVGSRNALWGVVSTFVAVDDRSPIYSQAPGQQTQQFIRHQIVPKTRGSKEMRSRKGESRGRGPCAAMPCPWAMGGF